MTYELIQDLCESRVFRTRQAMSRYSPQEAREFFYAYLVAAVTLSQEPATQGWAASYFSRTAAFGNFDMFRASGTDLYVLAHMVNTGQPSDLTNQRLVVNMRMMAQGRANLTQIQGLLLRLERSLGISDSRVKNVRRLLTTWRGIPRSTRNTNLQILRRTIMGFSRMSEILPIMDQATGAKGSMLKTAGILAAAGLGGLMLGLRYDPTKKVGPLRVKIGESMEQTQSTDEFIAHLESNPLVDHVDHVETTDVGITAVVRGRDGRTYAMAFTVLDGNGADSMEKGK